MMLLGKNMPLVTIAESRLEEAILPVMILVGLKPVLDRLMIGRRGKRSRRRRKTRVVETGVAVDRGSLAIIMDGNKGTTQSLKMDDVPGERSPYGRPY